ncbi:hypothetical protein EF405_20110 [Cyclobacteriaceae bacterium YHN15]|nr:hypothetical protein EF405_20110 [Cyclobacteriaceae bacterium YHN15]
MKKYIKNLGTLVANYIFEFFRFTRYSNVFSINNQNKLQGKITFYYHSLEKGLINDPIRLRFGAIKVRKLIYFLNIWLTRGYSTRDTQFLTACTVVNKYFILHKENNVEIPEIISETELVKFTMFNGHKDGGVIHFTGRDYFIHAESSFNSFSNSRHSVRNFNSLTISIDLAEKVVNLARNAPSVCNRQGYRVKFVKNKNLVQGSLSIQNGLNATAETVQQVFVITVDRSVFVSSSEWYQGFIDGGIFLQNLLYALHYYKIAAVPLNWSKHYFEDLKMHRLLSIPSSEKIIALVAAGYPAEQFKVPCSVRKDVSEILTIIE